MLKKMPILQTLRFSIVSFNDFSLHCKGNRRFNIFKPLNFVFSIGFRNYGFFSSFFAIIKLLKNVSFGFMNIANSMFRVLVSYRLTD